MIGEISRWKLEGESKTKKEKTYSDVINDKAVSDAGLFDVHKVDEKYFYEAIKEFNSSTNLFDKGYLNKVISGEDFQKKWYLANLANWHLSRSST